MADRAMSPSDACREVLRDPDPCGYTTFLADEGLLDTAALWALYDRHRIMAPADAWIAAARHFEDLDPRSDPG